MRKIISIALVAVLALWGAGTTSLIPLVIPDSIPSGNRQGSNGTNVFLCTGAFTTGHLVVVDASGNCIDGGAVPAGGISGPLFSNTADGGPITSSPGSLVGTGVGSATLAANYFSAGTIVHIYASGPYSSAGTPGPLTITMTLGGTTVLGPGAIVPVASANTATWTIEAYLICKTTGGTGTIHGVSQAVFTNSTNTSVVVAPLGDNSATFNTAGTLAIDLTASWGSFATGDSITGRTFIVSQL